MSYIYYNIIIFCIHLLTFKTLLASAFIVDFDRMSGGDKGHALAEKASASHPCFY